MINIKAGEYVKWTSEENGEKFTHFGQVISHIDGMIKMDDQYGGTMTYPDDDGTTKAIPQLPQAVSVEKGSFEYVAPTSQKDSPTKKVRKKRSSSAPSKKELAQKLYNTAIDKSRNDIIELFMTELDMSKAGASTYYYNVSK